MSIYDVVEIAEWKEKNMSCIYCKHFKGEATECDLGVLVTNGVESIYCDDYVYNGEVKE